MPAVTLRNNQGNERVVTLADYPSKGDKISVVDADGKTVTTSVKEVIWADGGEVAVAIVDGFGRT